MKSVARSRVQPPAPRQLLSIAASVTLLGLLAPPLPALSSPAGATHGSLPCSDCHAGEGGFSVPVTGSCDRCHAVQSAGEDRVLQAFHLPGRDCADCHSFHDPQLVRAGGVAFRVVERERCAACHVPGRSLASLSRGHREAAALYHSDGDASAAATPSELCLSCHSASGHRAAGATEASASSPRFREEASHPYGIPVSLGARKPARAMRATLDPRIRLFDGRIECATCHDLTVSGNDQLVSFEQRDDLCLGCHEMGGPESGSRIVSLALWPSGR